MRDVIIDKTEGGSVALPERLEAMAQARLALSVNVFEPIGWRIG
jgi:hypothetical protein